MLLALVVVGVVGVVVMVVNGGDCGSGVGGCAWWEGVM